MVTNQIGLARGIYGEEVIHKAHLIMEKELQGFGIEVSDWI